MTDDADRIPAGDVFVVPHVHWDREWYRTFESFRASLVQLVERVLDHLDSGTIPTFHLDGQTSTIGDVLAIRPDLEEPIRRHIRAGRLVVGPWHILADNQLCTGETLIRNLLIGRRWCERLGLTSSVGYSPDAFGHPADLPRVLRGFGIDNAVIWRGAPPEVARFTWTSPDGSSVLAINQAYYAADVLQPDPGAAGRFAAFVEAQRRRDPQGPWLLLDGADHLLVGDMTRRLDGIPEAGQGGQRGLGTHSGPTARVSTLADYVAAVKPLGLQCEVTGELRALGDYLTFLLPGTLSSLTWLKQLNRAAQLRLERITEPAVAHVDADDSALDLLQRAWEMVVQNTAHDSICGCSIDEVHAQTKQRALAALDIADRLERSVLLERGLDPRLRLGLGTDRPVSLIVRNPAGGPAAGPVVVEVFTDPAVHVCGLDDADGEPVSVEVTDLGMQSMFEADLDLMPDTATYRRHRVAFRSGLIPPLDEAVYRVATAADPQSADDSPAGLHPTTAQERTFEVDGWRVRVEDDATLTVTHGSTTWTGIARLVDEGDRGDTYNFDPTPEPVLPSPVVTSCRIESSVVRTVLTAEVTLTVPASLAPDRATRSGELVALPMRLEVTRWVGEPGLRVHVEGDNSAIDHRLRMVVPALGADHWAAGLQWSRIERPFAAGVGALPAAKGYEAAVAAAPTHGYAAANGPQPVVVLTRGMPEVAGVLDACSTHIAQPDTLQIAVTLLRATGWLSRYDLHSRTAGAGPELATPSAQVPGPFAADLVVLLGPDVPTDPATLQVAADVHDCGLSARVVSITPRRAPAAVTTLIAQAARPSAGMPAVTGALVGAWKRAEDRDGRVLRIWNPSGATVPATIEPGTIEPGTIGPDAADSADSTMMLTPCRFDEVSIGATTTDVVECELGPFATASYRVRALR